MKAWYGGVTLANGAGEPINDSTGQWMPNGCSPRMGATDSGHDDGILITNRVPGTASLFHTKGVSNSWNSAGSWLLRRMNYNGGSPTYEDTTITFADTATGARSDLTSAIAMPDAADLEWKWERTGGGSGDLRIPFLSYALTPSGTFAYQLNVGEKSSVTAASATRYFSPLGDNTLTTELNSMRIKVRVAGEITHAGLRVYSNARTTNTVFQLLLNGVAIGDGITFAGGALGYVEDTGFGTPVAVAVGDYLVWRVTSGTGTELLEYTTASVTITPTTEGQFQCGVSSNSTTVAAATTRYGAVMGECVNVIATDNGNTKIVAPFAMTLDSFVGYLRAYSLNAGDATLGVRVNGAVQRSIVWTAVGEAAPADGSAFDVAAGDELDFSMVCGGSTGSVQLMNLTFRGIEIVSGGAGSLLSGRLVHGGILSGRLAA